MMPSGKESRMDSPCMDAENLAETFIVLKLDNGEGHASCSDTTNAYIEPATTEDVDFPVEDPSVLSKEDAAPREGLMKLPPEIRVKIYELLLVPPCTKTISASHNQDQTSCSFAREPLISSYAAKTNRHLRSVGCHCSACRQQAAHVDTAILATNRTIFWEASAVLYENSQVVAHNNPGSKFYRLVQPPSHGWRQVKRLQLTFASDCALAYEPRHRVSMEEQVFWWDTCHNEDGLSGMDLFSNVKHVSFHIELCFFHHEVDMAPFLGFHVLADAVTFEVNVHIFQAFIDDGSNGWAELIITRKGHEKACDALQGTAEKLREDFIDKLALSFREHGKVLRLCEE